MSTSSTCWLAADYYFPAAYSCRVPLSSMSSVRAMPAPGPATVRMAIIRIAIEMFGEDFTRNTIFPIICSMSLAIRPPEQVAFSDQIMRAYKASSVDCIEEAPIYRQVAHAVGPLTIYLNVPKEFETIFCELLTAVGYWGTADSLTYCSAIHETAPLIEECIIPLRTLTHASAVQSFFTCLVAEFCRTDINWHYLMPESHTGKQELFRFEMYIWPMIICERRIGGVILRRRSFLEK